MDDPTADIDHIRASLPPDEAVVVAVPAVPGTLALTDRRLMVAIAGRIALNVPIEEVRRIQLDVERDRPATLVIVPDSLQHELQVMAVPMKSLPATAQAVTYLGARLDKSA